MHIISALNDVNEKNLIDNDNKGAIDLFTKKEYKKTHTVAMFTDVVEEKMRIVNDRKIDLLIKINEYFRIGQDPDETEEEIKVEEALWPNQAAAAAWDWAELPEFCLPSITNQEFVCPASYPMKVNDSCYKPCLNQ